jgi:peptide/nickel transport system permease protein
MAIKSRAIRKLLRDRLAKAAFVVVVVYVLTSLAVRTGVATHLVLGTDAGAEAFLGDDAGATGGGDEALPKVAGEPILTTPQDVAFFSEPSSASWLRWLGTDRQGRSILLRAIWSIDVAIIVGCVTGLAAVLIGTLLGAVAGYFGGRVDAGIVWFYSTVESIPPLLLLLVLSYSTNLFFDRLYERTQIGAFSEPGLIVVCVALCATFWTGPCRVIRGEAIRLRDGDFVTAAVALGASRVRVVLRHVLPNVAHISLVYFSLAFIGAVKSEVILSFLGFGVRNRPSWGLMIDSAARGGLAIDFYWEIGAATVFMFLLVLASNVFTDSLQDALDPKTH